MNQFSEMLSSIALVVVIVIDQFRTDQLIRARQMLPQTGIMKIVDQGIFYDDAHFSHFLNMTCPGHVAISTGAMPGLSGIMSNEDWDYEKRQKIYCVDDPEHVWLSADKDNKEGHLGTSGKRILTSTVGDEMKLLWPKDSKVVSVALKDRSAIGLAGHVADGVYWFARKSNVWTTSTAYTTQNVLPPWLKKINTKVAARETQAMSEYDFSDLSVEDTTDVALAAAAAEKMGQHQKTDLLWVSYSTHDLVAHNKGDDSDELHSILKTEDKNISRLMSALQKQVGPKRKVLFVLTADHGAGAYTPQAVKAKMPAGRIDEKGLTERLNQCLKSNGVKTKSGAAVDFIFSSNIYLSNEIKDKSEARAKTKECLKKENEGVWMSFTREEMQTNQIPQTPWLKNLAATYHPQRGPDVLMVLQPYWNVGSKHSLSHETSYDYDSWVPLALWWSGAKKQHVHRRVEVTSLAPSLARVLGTRRPSGAYAEYLPELIENLEK